MLLLHALTAASASVARIVRSTCNRTWGSRRTRSGSKPHSCFRFPNFRSDRAALVVQGETALYDPSTGRWQMLPTPPGHPSLAATPLWAGTQLLELADSGALWSFRR